MFQPNGTICFASKTALLHLVNKTASVAWGRSIPKLIALTRKRWGSGQKGDQEVGPEASIASRH